ncbi:hypothetical protein [Streptosporangium sp. V21-05]|uniref:hypothetical protein n=1 Tax=Streptosporangium sp. V21-05 TaxID=3446115 RepID=UPI003F53A799
MTGPMRENDPARGGARWCEQHERWECAKRGKTVPVCHGIAIAGIDACRMHAGQRAEVAKAKGEAVSAWSALHGESTVSATEAVLGMLQMSWARVHLYAGLLRRQVEEAQGARSDPDGGPDGDAEFAAPGEDVGHGAGLVGVTRGAVKDIGIYATGEAVRGLAALEAQERDRCVRFAKVCHDMGIAEQQVRLAEQQGVMLADVIRGTADGLLASVLGVLSGGGDAEQVRRSWPGWLERIVPAQIEAVAGGER